MQDDNWVLVGVIQGAHGVRGLLKVKSLSDNPARFAAGSRLYVIPVQSAGDQGQKGALPLTLTVTSASPHSGKLLLTCAEITDRESAAALMGTQLMAEPDETPLPEGQYYHYQLLGLSIYEHGKYLGRLTEILSRPANDIYVMQAERGEEIWIPALKTVVKKIDLRAQRMEVELPEGLK